MKTYILLLLLFCGFLSNVLQSQTITGAWKGRIGSAHTELKLIKKGDSLLGTSYYYTSRNNYVRYAVKGYFDPNSNSVVWWDDAMLEDRLSGKIFGADGKEALLSVADFNCPGEKTMRLDGESTDRDDKDKPRGTVALQKITSSGFHDEWDFVLENYIYGANDPEIIDSVARMHGVPNEVTEERETELASTTVKSVPKNDPSIAVKAPPIVEKKKATPVPAGTAQQKFSTREKKLATVIPITGDSIELRFYDNAVVDGDSIAVFMNDKMVFEHVRLNNKPYTLKLSVDDLPEDNEMVMVAENLGTIPPNTSLMVAIVDGKRFEARLESTENSSALIRFIKQKKNNNRQ
ncbi:hypothetical protein [Niastella sp. OAS944]|uniref:hypothetical protein n=1 Tax=Niastella sp. OAS944 TaxID=2664089 RepID=UPI0035C7DF08|nr:hypothetical protein [Chitinophagaceae bacterium OAS944]